MARVRRNILAGAAPLSPQRKWRAITLATLLFVPAYWSIVAALVSLGGEDGRASPNAGPLIAFGLCLLPFVFIVLAFLSEHPKAPAAVVKAMGLVIVVGIPVSALAADAVSGLVAAVGAAGIVALRADMDHNWKARAVAVVLATVYIFFLLRTASDVALLMGPVLPFTGIGVADHLSERKRDRDRQAAAREAGREGRCYTRGR
ncbi:MAG: hypothetical protein ACXWYT_02585 [Actinomycetota bacterium]